MLNAPHPIHIWLHARIKNWQIRQGGCYAFSRILCFRRGEISNVKIYESEEFSFGIWMHLHISAIIPFMRTQLCKQFAHDVFFSRFFLLHFARRSIVYYSIIDATQMYRCARRSASLRIWIEGKYLLVPLSRMERIHRETHTTIQMEMGGREIYRCKGA